MRVLMALALMASPVLAQDNRGTDFMVQRLKERLKLSEDQTAKVKEILAKDAEDRTKMDDARTERIGALLDAEQKKAYEEMRSNQRGFGGGGRQFQFGGGGGGRGGPMGAVNVEDVKRELGLSDEQVEKIKPLYDEFNASLQKRADELREKGWQGLNIGEEMQKYQENLKALAEKVKAHVTDEQKTKLDGLVERATGMMRLIPNLMNQGGARASGAPAPRPSVEDRVRSVVAALKIEKDDERSAVADLVSQIVKAHYELEDYAKSSREKLAEAAKNRELSDAAVEDRIKEVQEERRKREKEIAGLQRQLSEAVTNRQELELMAQGILK